MADLATFASEAPQPVRGVRCWACYLPEAAELNAAKRNNTATLPQMVAWLVEDRGYDPEEARRPRLTNHFQAQHHQRWPDGRA